MQNIILINKPKGITSFGVIAELRRKLKIKKIGHAGTLDPLAEGLLIIGIGTGTKKLSEFVGLNKTYIFEILFGTKTTTADLEGEVIKTQKISEIDREKLVEVLNKLTGKIRLEVPAYSAVKIKGKALYKYARQGKKVILPVRENEIFSLELLNLHKEDNDYVAKVKVKCSSGTYVRSLVEKIGEMMNMPTVAKSIKRVAIGDYKLENALNLDKISEKNCE